MESLAMIDISFWKNKKVLITGHTGFKGAWLSLWLLKYGCKVYGYSLAPTGEPNLFKLIQSNLGKNFHHYEGNILDEESLNNYCKGISPDIVFHLAAQPLVLKSYEDPIETWQTNVIGSLNLLESLRNNDSKCSVVMITTDKVYENKEWIYGYRENDPLGGYDPYSASKAAAEIAIASWRNSFCGNNKFQTQLLSIATARAGNVIGGGDWANDRIIPDCIRSLIKKEAIKLRNPNARRPWQHVIEPLSGYMFLAEKLYLNDNFYSEAFNFGPNIESNKTVKELSYAITDYWPSDIIYDSFKNKPHEANLLHLNYEKAYQILNWKPIWNFSKTIENTINWYKDFHQNKMEAFELCNKNIDNYLSDLEKH